MEKDFKLDSFPLSKTKKAKGSRRLVREKALQILVAFDISATELDFLYEHIFFREFQFEDAIPPEGKLLRPAEIIELEADTPIDWKDSEIDFGRNLINQIVSNKNEFEVLIAEFTKNWEVDRIATIDKYLLMIAITELLYFPEIPTKVSLDEAIDISKKYSTEKSSMFINGVLDAILIKLTEEGRIRKTGKGLLDNK
ncbi:MAG: transcription antitermination factor NusB [Chloroflexota bacterium]